MAKVAAERITVLPGPTVGVPVDPRPPRFGSASTCRSLRLAVTGAAVVPVRGRASGCGRELHFERVVTGYGLTETTGTISMCRHDDPPEVIADTVGQPLPGVEILVVEIERIGLPPAAPGEFWVRGFNVMKGYFADPAATAAAIDAGRLAEDRRHWPRRRRTATSGSPTARRTCSSWADSTPIRRRSRSMSAGPPSLEPGRRVGVPDERLGEVGAAFVVPRAGRSTSTRDELIAAGAASGSPTSRFPAGCSLSTSLPLTPQRKGHEVRAERLTP